MDEVQEQLRLLHGKSKEELFSYERRLVADRDARTTVTLTCKDSTGKENPLDGLQFTITSRNPPRATLSTGVMVSLVEKRIFRLNVEKDEDLGNDDAGNPVTTQRTIHGDLSRPQVVPFFFVNLHLFPDKRWFCVAPGLGINPNLGTEVEFALGPSFQVGNVFLFAGFHWGRPARLAGGFSIGDRVPVSNFDVPVRTSWETGFGMAVSYSVSLP